MDFKNGFFLQKQGGDDYPGAGSRRFVINDIGDH
jgi:hypothetical protein